MVTAYTIEAKHSLGSKNARWNNKVETETKLLG